MIGGSELAFRWGVIPPFWDKWTIPDGFVLVWAD